MEKDFNTKQEVVLHLEALKEASATIETAIRLTLDIIRKFDGKQFTRRITNLAQKAVDEALGEHVVSVVYDVNDFHFGVEFYLSKRSYPVQRKRWKDEVTDWVSFDGDLYKSVTCWDGNRYAIQASLFEKSAEQALKANAGTLYRYADAVEHFDEYVLAYRKAVTDLQQACGAINPLFLDHMVYTTDARVCRTWHEKAEQALQA